MLVILLMIVMTNQIEANLEIEESCGVILNDRCPDLQKRVVSGVASCAEKAPWNVLIERRSRRKRRRRRMVGGGIGILCGGTLVSSRHIVTAAHCVFSNRNQARSCREPYLSMSAKECARSRCPPQCLRLGPDSLNVYVGVTDRSKHSKSDKMRVEKIIIHPGWDRKDPLNNITAGHDLAVLVLAKPVSFSTTVWPACVPTTSDRILQSINTPVEAFGFGVRDIVDDDRIYAEILNKANLKMTDRVKCRSLWKTNGDQLCAKGDEEQSSSRIPDTCSGDSGGGLVARRSDDRFVVMGVVSFGESDCGVRGGRPGVYTNLLTHSGWVRRVMGTGSSCTTEDGRSCVFPFKFRGETYTGCTTDHDPDGRSWCSTQVTDSGVHVENAGQWDYCSKNCINISASPKVQSLSRKWSSWGTWSPCSKSCGGGKKVRSRQCFPKSGGCEGQDIQTKICNPDVCKGSDSWSAWSSWSGCSVTCGAGVRSRRRSCSSSSSVANSVGLRGGQGCPGEGREQKQCRSTKLCNRGKRKEWTSWGEFGACSSSCIGGIRQRRRECKGDRGQCFGSPTDTESCGRSDCAVVKPQGDGSMATVLVGGWYNEDWLSNVTVLQSSGKTCPGPSLPIWLADHFSVFDGSRILTCGGRSGDKKTLCWYWNLAAGSDKWERAPQMLTGRSYADSVVSLGRVWVTGGWDGKVRHKTSEVLEGTGGWREGHPLTSKRYQHCGVVLGDGSVVVTGGQEGETGQGEALALVERYRWNGARVQELPSLNQARWTHGCGVIEVRGREAVIVAGGRVTSSPGDSLSMVEVMVVGEPFWRVKKSLPQPRLAPSLVVIGGHAQVSGGNYETGTRREELFPDSVLEYDPDKDDWRTVARIRGLSHHVALAIPSKFLPRC